MTDLLLDIRNLHVATRMGAPILRGIDLSLHRGEVMGLIGESGAGKSTLGLAAMGYVQDGCRIGGGTVHFDGHDLLALPEKQRRLFRGARIAYVAQSAAASFNPAWRLIDQFTEAPRLQGHARRAESEADAHDLYGRMGLPDPADFGLRFPHQVSGGQLQRAMTAMAMACRPDLIVFDEPTTALDVTTQIEVLAAIRSVVRDLNSAALYITHDLAVVAQMADRIKVLRHGEEVEEAPTGRLISAPEKAYTRSLWAVRNLTRPARPKPAEVALPALRLKRVTASYGRKMAVLQDVSIDFAAGRTIAVVGESGSGKSTTARAITGLLQPLSGDIELRGRLLPAALRDRTKADLRSIQMIYQMADTALNPRQTLREIIGRPAAFYGGLRGAALEARVRDLLAAIELEPGQFINRRPGELSGGQKQRVGIARALAAEPEFIICDEVTSALDQLVAEGILKLLMRLQEQTGVTYMFITHDLSTVRAIADSVVVMQKGAVVDQGSRDHIFQQSTHPYTRRLLASVPETDTDWLTRTLAQRGRG
jgi:peptide/nickel transport system ATP-binding protein